MHLPSSTLKSFLMLYLSAAILIYAALFWRSRRMIQYGYPDFAIYYCAGTVVRQGLARQFYDHATRFPVEEQFAALVPQFRDPLPYTHPPFEALFFVPFSHLPFSEAYILWDAMNLGLIVACLFLVRPHLSHLSAACSPLVLIMMALAFFPLILGLLQGQDALLLLFLYTLTFVNLEKQRFATAGFWLALGLFKFHLVVPFLLLLLVQKKFRLLYGFLPTAAALAGISVFTVGVQGILAYPNYVWTVEKELTTTEFVPAVMPSLRGLLYVIFGESAFVAPTLFLLCAGLLAFAAWKCWEGQDQGVGHLKFCLALLATALIGYHVMSHDLSMLLLCVFLLANYLLAERRLRPWSAGLILGMAAFFFPPLNLFLSLQCKYFALMSLPLLACLLGIARELAPQKDMRHR